MSTLERAIEIAAAAHAGQRDKVGEPYILHPLRVMALVRTDEARIVAVLHDVIEDGPWKDGGKTLVEAGFEPGLIDAVRCLTRNHDESYEAFIERCAGNALAREVKLADIADNLDAERLQQLSPPTQRRLRQKYLPARHRLLHGAWPDQPDEAQ